MNEPSILTKCYHLLQLSNGRISAPADHHNAHCEFLTQYSSPSLQINTITQHCRSLKYAIFLADQNFCTWSLRLKQILPRISTTQLQKSSHTVPVTILTSDFSNAILWTKFVAYPPHTTLMLIQSVTATTLQHARDLAQVHTSLFKVITHTLLFLYLQLPQKGHSSQPRSPKQIIWKLTNPKCIYWSH